MRRTAVPLQQRMRTLEAARLGLLERMLTLRRDCADMSADPRRSQQERDGAAWALAHAVELIVQCDDELHALRQQAREEFTGEQPVTEAAPPDDDEAMVRYG